MFFICQTGNKHPSSQVAMRLTEIMSAKKSAPFFLHSPNHKATVGVVGCILHVEMVKGARMGLKSSLYSICQATHPGTCLSQEGAFVQFIHPKGALPSNLSGLWESLFCSMSAYRRAFFKSAQRCVVCQVAQPGEGLCSLCALSLNMEGWVFAAGVLHPRMGRMKWY